MSTPTDRPRASLDGQVALVTGAARGIGSAIAVELGRLGAMVFINYRSDEAAARATADAALSAGAAEVATLQGDVGIPEQSSGLVGRVLEAAGRIDVLVNNAGIQTSSMMHRMSDEAWQKVIDVNLSGVFHTSRSALRWMREQGSGHIVNIASASSFVAQPGAASYVAAKHGLIGLTKAMAIENASRGVLVNAVAPGMTDTDMIGALDDEQRSSLEKLIPMKRAAMPREVADMVAFVVTSAGYSTGNVFHVSGGVVMG